MLFESDAIPVGSTVKLNKAIACIPIDSDLTFHLAKDDMGIISHRQQKSDFYEYRVYMYRTRVFVEIVHDDLEIVKRYNRSS
ncbi:MAG: hypothetical protein HW405_672 [Candidatus Berkelbacteria bacterium]|nr:hypothetical protein [Candidatus Berkelbacteria bacterium]